MEKTGLGNCAKCGKPFDDETTIWYLKGTPYHPSCIRRDRILRELWGATDWRDKDIL